ncbi:DUF547 domain-containing protein [Algibacter sp. PT7-4]|uniref:DUF547 domain-containing protein n=1 Tax=Algibacter ulvanivorans TaxID=3400999 RepID=UPI003AAAA9AF
MRYSLLLFILLFISSCYSAKPAYIKQTKQSQRVVTTKKDTIKTKVLTENQTTTKQPELHQLWDELLKQHVTKNGIVNYKSFKTEHKKLLDYIFSLGVFYKKKHFKTISKEKKLAFWINAYNAMTIDLILKHYPIQSIKDIEKPWDKKLWKTIGIPHNLNEIEHTILRKMDEPRIHFAIVCASFSCPKLLNKAYKAEIINNQLTYATKNFLNDTNRNEISTNRIKLSKIFQWFSKDFKQNGSLINFLNQYAPVKISAKAKKSFKDYNWVLNE